MPAYQPEVLPDKKENELVPDPEMTDPLNQRTHEQLLASFMLLDPDLTGIISTADCTLALKDCQGFVTKEQEMLIAVLERETLKGDKLIDYYDLIERIELAYKETTGTAQAKLP